MVCICSPPTSEEMERGVRGCGEDCLNRMLMIEWYVFFSLLLRNGRFITVSFVIYSCPELPSASPCSSCCWRHLAFVAVVVALPNIVLSVASCNKHSKAQSTMLTSRDVRDMP